MNEINTILSEKEIKAIKLIIGLNEGSDLQTLTKILLRVFGHEIKPYHYIVLGSLIGQRVAALQERANIINFTKVCQRQN